MADLVVINKCESIARCLKRIRDDFTGIESLKGDFMRQDAIILNIQRACEQSIDLANHLIKVLKLGIPKNSKDAFELLGNQEIISTKLSSSLSKMVAFRNIAVHEYTQLNLDIVISIVEKDLKDFEEFTQIAAKYA